MSSELRPAIDEGSSSLDNSYLETSFTPLSSILILAFSPFFRLNSRCWSERMSGPSKDLL
jgi:hypothetical protein